VNRMIKEELGTWTVPVKVPVPLVRAIAWLAEKASAPFGKYPAFNLEKVNELECLNWQCDATPIREQLDFRPEYELEKGIAETVSWYRKESWL
ncbi:MAG: NAD(P)-dependent oxidoreductase, partial [Bacteroidota bacterium]